MTAWNKSAAASEQQQGGCGSPGVPQPNRLFVDGRSAPPEPPLELRAGPLSLLFEDAGLRYIRLGDHELVRRIYSAVRDENWGTVPATISNPLTEIRADSFEIEFDVRHAENQIDFTWHGAITGESSGRVTFTMDGVANTTFRKNRIGFCILHPLELAGLPVEIEHVSGRREAVQFPRYIAPNNPFLNVVALHHAAGPSARLSLRFAGDVFETEDQRNWIDASFKTFCTPLSRPFPAEIHAGERVWQQITLELETAGLPPAITASCDRPIELAIADKPSGAIPRLGFNLPTTGSPLTERESELLSRLQPAHLRCELRTSGDFQPQLERATQIATDLATRLDLALFIGPNVEAELSALFAAVRSLGKPPVCRWSVFPAAGWSTTPELARQAAAILRKHNSNIPVGGGTAANFLELNRQRPPVGELDFVTWSLQPQEHAFDNASLVETLAAHASAVQSAQQFTGGLPIVVGPVTLKKRINPYATGVWPPAPAADELPLPVDVRQLSLFGAGWTLGSIKYLAEAGVNAATYYELVGWKGLVESEAGSPLPARFPSLAGSVFPLYHVFADLAELNEASVLPVKSSDPLRVDAMAVRQGVQTRLMLANFTDQPQRVVVPHQRGTGILRLLDSTNVLAAMADPKAYRETGEFLRMTLGRTTIDLPPFAIARLDMTN